MRGKERNINGLTRRRFLALGLGGALLSANPAWAKASERSVAFVNLHTGERLKTTYWQNGSYLPGELQSINHLLRDHYNDHVGVMDPHLIDLLYNLQQRLGERRPFEVISGFRSEQTNAMLRKNSSGVAKQSLHMRGMAIDVRLPGNDLVRLLNTARQMRSGGVGYYPKSRFVHLDVGRVRTWNG